MTKGGDVETETASALNHYISANVAELMAEHCGTDDGIVVDNNLAGKLCGVADDATVAYFAVVGNVHVLHKEIIVAYNGLALAGCATADGDILTNTVVVANLAGCFLAAELEVLRLGAYTCPGKELIAVAYSCTSVDGDTVHEVVVVANHSVLVDIAEWPDNVVVAKFCLGMDKGHRTNGIHSFRN